MLMVKKYVMIVLVVLLICMMSLWVGRFHMSLSDFIHALFWQDANLSHVLWQLRMPRLLAGLMVGASLAISGAVYQVLFKNPLVSPDILGVSAGAGFGAIVAIFFGLNLFLIEISAFLFGLLAVFLVYALASQLKHTDQTLVLVLTGVVVSAIFGALISLFKILADPYTQLSTMTFWLMGGLNTILYHELYYTLPLVIMGLLPIILLRWRINVLYLSDEEATSLGLNVKALRLLFIVCATFITSSVVAISGMIGWVGLLIPHIARLLVGQKFSSVLMLSALLGGAFLLACDTASRTIAAIDLPISILTSFVGAPFFIWLLIKKDKKR